MLLYPSFPWLALPAPAGGTHGTVSLAHTWHMCRADPEICLRQFHFLVPAKQTRATGHTLTVSVVETHSYHPDSYQVTVCLCF